jgi:hypothetical protein
MVPAGRIASLPSPFTSRLEAVTVRGSSSVKFGVTATVPLPQMGRSGGGGTKSSAQVIRLMPSTPVNLSDEVPSNLNAIRDDGISSQASKPTCSASMARCSVTGETPPTQVGLPSSQLSMTPCSLIFQETGIARSSQAIGRIAVPLLTITSRVPPARGTDTASPRVTARITRAPRGPRRTPPRLRRPDASGRRRLIVRSRVFAGSRSWTEPSPIDLAPGR